MSDTGYGDFEFERKFFVRELPAVVRTEPEPVLIVQSYFLAAEGYALRIRLEAPAGELDPAAAAAADDALLAALAGKVSVLRAHRQGALRRRHALRGRARARPHASASTWSGWAASGW